MTSSLASELFLALFLELFLKVVSDPISAFREPIFE